MIISNKKSIVLWGGVGVLWGLVNAFLSILVAGAGHGWVAALPFGVLAIFTTPLTTIAWSTKETNGKNLAIIALAIAVIANVLLVWATITEGVEYFNEVLLMAIVWIVMWSSWQVLAVIVLLSGKSANFK